MTTMTTMATIIHRHEAMPVDRDGQIPSAGVDHPGRLVAG